MITKLGRIDNVTLRETETLNSNKLLTEKTDFFYWTQPSKVVGHNVLTEIFTLVKTKRRRITIGRKERSICLISKKTLISRSPHSWRARVSIVYSKFLRLERSALPSSTGSYKTRGVTSPLLTFFFPMKLLVWQIGCTITVPEWTLCWRWAMTCSLRQCSQFDSLTESCEFNRAECLRISARWSTSKR